MLLNPSGVQLPTTTNMQILEAEAGEKEVFIQMLNGNQHQNQRQCPEFPLHLHLSFGDGGCYLGHSLALVSLLEVQVYCWCHHWPHGFPKVPQTHWPVLPEVGKKAISLPPWVYISYLCAGPGAQTSLCSGRVPLPNQSPLFPRLHLQVFAVWHFPSRRFDLDGTVPAFP